MSSKKYVHLGLLIGFGIAISTLFLGDSFNWDFQSATIRQWKKALEILTGFWLLAAMVMACDIMVLRPQSVRAPGVIPMHKKVACAVIVFLTLHWVAAKGLSWAHSLGLIAGGTRPVRAQTAQDFTGMLYGVLGHHVTWIGLVLILLFAMALCRYCWSRPWGQLAHRAMLAVTILGAIHAIFGFNREDAFGFGQCAAIAILIYTLVMTVRFFVMWKKKSG